MKGGSIVLSSLRTLWRRQWILYLCVPLTLGMALAYHTYVGERYEASALLRVGQGIKERSGGAILPFEGIDLQSKMETLSRIAKIDQVIQEAANNTGHDRLFPRWREADEPTALQTVLDNLQPLASKAWAWGNAHDTATEAKKDEKNEEQAAQERLQAAIFGLRDRVVAKQEGRSDLLRITFRHKDPEVAARFLDELSSALVALHTADAQMPGAHEFFEQQTRRLEEEAEKAAYGLESFSVKAAIYAVDEQRLLLLKRANELATSMSTTRGVMEDRKGQRRAIVDQLQVLKPVTHSRTVTRVVRTLSGLDSRKAVESASEQAELQETPPLLLVKVYQDNMAALMKVDAELRGATELLQQLGTELEQVNKELALLSSKEAEYGRLKRVMTTASTAAEHYAKRMLEEQINAEVAKKSQLSSLRVVEKATPPSTPVFPQAHHLVGLSLGGGILLGFALIFGPGMARASMLTQRQPEPGISDDERVSLFVARQRKDGPKEHQIA